MKKIITVILLIFGLASVTGCKSSGCDITFTNDSNVSETIHITQTESLDNIAKVIKFMTEVKYLESDDKKIGINFKSDYIEIDKDDNEVSNYYTYVGNVLKSHTNDFSSSATTVNTEVYNGNEVSSIHSIDSYYENGEDNIYNIDKNIDSLEVSYNKIAREQAENKLDLFSTLIGDVFTNRLFSDVTLAGIEKNLADFSKKYYYSKLSVILATPDTLSFQISMSINDLLKNDYVDLGIEKLSFDSGISFVISISPVTKMVKECQLYTTDFKSANKVIEILNKGYQQDINRNITTLNIDLKVNFLYGTYSVAYLTEEQKQLFK